MLRRFLAILVLSFIPVSWSAPASASGCGNITSDGLCRDLKTLVFCHDGEVEVWTCPAGELCTADPRFDGASGCLAARYITCEADLTAPSCVGESLITCEEGVVVETQCGPAQRCSIDVIDDVEVGSCVVPPSHVAGPNSHKDPKEPPIDDQDEFAEGMPDAPRPVPDLPVVEPDTTAPGADDDPDSLAPGCAASTLATNVPFALLALGWLARRRRNIA